MTTPHAEGPSSTPALPGGSAPVAPRISVRDATAAEWPAIWPFFSRIVSAGETYCWPTDLPERRARKEWMELPGGVVLVATAEDGTVVGSAVIHPNRDGHGDHVANASFMVDPARSGNGIGRALGDAVLARARADGYAAMQFNAVVESNTGAVRLWRSLGFEILTTIPRSFRHPKDGYVGLHIMWREL